MEAFSRSEASVWLAEAAVGEGMQLLLTPCFNALVRVLQRRYEGPGSIISV